MRGRRGSRRRARCMSNLSNRVLHVCAVAEDGEVSVAGVARKGLRHRGVARREGEKRQHCSPNPTQTVSDFFIPANLLLADSNSGSYCEEGAPLVAGTRCGKRVPRPPVAERCSFKNGPGG